MKKLLLLTTVFTLVSLLTYSQQLSKDFNYTVGKPYKVIDAVEKNFFNIGDNVIVAKIDDDVLSIQKFDATTLSQIKKTEVSNFPKGFGWEPLTALNNKFYVFYNSYIKDTKTEQLFYRELDIDNVTLGEDKLLCSVDGKITGTLYGKGYSFKTRDKFNFQYSYDSSKVLIQYRKKSSNDDAPAGRSLLTSSYLNCDFKPQQTNNFITLVTKQ